MSVLLCIVGIVLVFLNGFFVLVEFALVKARQTQLELLKSRGSALVPLALEMKRHIDGYLSAAQLGITMCSLALGWVGEPAFARLFAPVFQAAGIHAEGVRHSLSVVLSFALITFLLTVFGEMAPKYIGIREPEESVLMIARPMRVFYWVLYAPMTVLNYLSNRVLEVLGYPTVTREETTISEEELRLVLAHAHREGEMTLDRVLLFENVLDFGELTTASVMVPLVHVAMLDLQKPWAENMATIRNRKYSRYPLCDGDPQRVVGMVHVKDLAFAALNADAPLALARFRREIPRVQESMPVEALMRFIQRRPTNLALVTDAAGTVKGIVTFEDVLEELVGEIADEFESEMPWRLSEHVDRSSVVMGLKATDRMGAIRELAGALRHRAIGLDPNLVIEQAMGREAESPTAVGHGIALPHARLEGLGRCCVAYGRSLKGINFRAPDGLPVTHVFLILSPKERPRQQLQALARVAAIAASEILLGKLNDATTPEGVLELFAAADVSTTLDS